MEVWEVIQDAAMESVPGLYDKKIFIEGIERMTIEQFSRFYPEYLHIREFYDNCQGGWVTDHIPFAKQHPDMVWKVPPVDFDRPVKFIRLK